MDLRLLMALSYLADHDGAHQQELVDALCMDAKNVVLLLNELEHCGYLIRRRDSEDRRRHRVHITTAGREALERAAQARLSARRPAVVIARGGAGGPRSRGDGPGIRGPRAR